MGDYGVVSVYGGSAMTCMYLGDMQVGNCRMFRVALQLRQFEWSHLSQDLKGITYELSGIPSSAHSHWG